MTNDLPWQPMHTAPRDHRKPVILYVQDGEFGERVETARWVPFYICWEPEFELASKDPRPIGWAKLAA